MGRARIYWINILGLDLRQMLRFKIYKVELKVHGERYPILKALDRPELTDPTQVPMTDPVFFPTVSKLRRVLRDTGYVHDSCIMHMGPDLYQIVVLGSDQAQVYSGMAQLERAQWPGCEFFFGLKWFRTGEMDPMQVARWTGQKISKKAVSRLKRAKKI